MPITLSVHTYRNAAPAQPMSRRFDRLGGALGRATGNELVLDDPGKYISRVHARIEYRDGGYCLVDVGSNPSLVNERPVGAGRHVRLNDGDRIGIGDYQLVASVESEAAPMLPPSPLQVEPPRIEPLAGEPLRPGLATAPGLAAFVPASLTGDAGDSLASAGILDVGGDPLSPSFDPLGLNLFGAPPAGEPSVPAWRGAESDHVAPELAPFPAAQPQPLSWQQAPPPMPPLPAVSAPPSAAAGPMAIPDDYDPLADFLPPRVQAARPPSAPPASASTFAPPPPPPPAAVPVSEPLPAVSFAPPQPAVAPEDATAIGPQALAPEAAPALPPAFPPVPAPAPVAASAEPFASAPPVPSSQPAAPAAPRAASGSAANDPIIQALLRGMGLDELHTKRSAEEIAELAGAMLREATAGTMGVLMGRAMTKRESRLDMTMIAAQANNPLKFFPDVDSALAQMMGGRTAGYMAPQRAFANAFDDLKAHELAIMAGMRAALDGVLKRFDPQAIEARLQEPSVMDKVLGSNRKAKMWDRMVELYARLASEADSDFHRLFGEAFGAAYEEQIQRLRDARR